MNTVSTFKDGRKLKVTIYGAFNLRATKRIKSRLSPSINKLNVNLIDCNMIDSEGVIFLHRWQDNGNKLKLKEPPSVLFEILEILELDGAWDLDNIIIN